MDVHSQMMNQHQVISHLQPRKTDQSELVNQSQSLNRFQVLNSQIVSQPPMVSQMNPPQMMNPMVSHAQLVAQPPMLGQSKMLPQSYGNWAQQPPNLPPGLPPMGGLKFTNQMNPMYGASKPGRSNNWKGKKSMDKRKDFRRKDMVIPGDAGAGGPGGGASGGSFKPPVANELEHQNRLKARRFYHRKKFNRMGPYAHAPRNTTSYLIRAKKEGGIASLVSPCPVTPAVLPTPVFSPLREELVDVAKEEWGVDGYGSMKGLIRLRSSPGHEAEMDDYDDEEDDSSESDVEEHLEVERRLDHDLSRFEMIYPASHGMDYNIVLGSRVDDQDTHIAQLEEENLCLKEKLYLMERELGEIKRRMQCLERQNQNQVVEDVNEELVENVSDNETEVTRGAVHDEEKEGNVGGALSVDHSTAQSKELCQQNGLLQNQETHTESEDGRKEDDHDISMAVSVGKVDEIESIAGKDSVSLDVGQTLVKNDAGAADNASDDLPMEDSSSHKQLEDDPSEQ